MFVPLSVGQPVCCLFLSSSLFCLPIWPDCASIWMFFKQELQKAIDMHVPHKITKAKSHLPWLSRTIKRHMRKRDKLLKKARHSRENSDWSTYRKQWNKVVNLMKSSYNDYICNIIGGSLFSNPKRLWSHVKMARTENMEIPSLKKNGIHYISNTGKAEALSNQFRSVFTSDHGPDPDKGASAYPDIPDIQISRSGVKTLLSDLKINKAGGPDLIPARILRDLSEEICDVLAFIIQQSYDSGNLPLDWSKALVTAVHEKDKKDNPSNYRPISLTCLCCKIMERIILSHTNAHLARNNILSTHQHGFRKKLSCTTQLISSIHNWATSLNNRSQTDVLFLDFSNAFDKVSHRKLIIKLKYYGI